MTEQLDPYEPEPSYDWDYGEPQRGPKILWGRIVALAAIVIFAFVIGRVSAPAGVDPETLEDARARIGQLRDDLEAALAQPAPPPPGAPTETTSPAPPVEGEQYTVEAGDTLRVIAQRFYKDPALDDCIAAANEIADPTLIRVGQTLTIPPKETCG